MGFTTNYNLEKQENKSAYFSMDKLNENMDKIDSALGKDKVTIKSVIGEVTATMLSTEWTGTGPFEDTAPVVIAGEQITNTTHDIKVSLVLSSDINIAKQEQEAYSCFSKGEISATNVLKITCFDYKPSVNLNLLLEVIKKW